MLMMLKRGLADADDAWAWGWLKLRMLGQEPADDAVDADAVDAQAR